MNTGFVYKLFGVANFNQYFYNDNTQISLINDRFSILNEIEDIWNCALSLAVMDHMLWTHSFMWLFSFAHPIIMGR